MSSKEKHNRRRFIQSILAGGTAAGLGIAANAIPANGEKIKMLTADGRLVEVDKSVIEKNAGARRASDQEVFDWMDPKHKA